MRHPALDVLADLPVVVVRRGFVCPHRSGLADAVVIGESEQGLRERIDDVESLEGLVPVPVPGFGRGHGRRDDVQAQYDVGLPDPLPGIAPAERFELEKYCRRGERPLFDELGNIFVPQVEVPEHAPAALALRGIRLEGRHAVDPYDLLETLRKDQKKGLSHIRVILVRSRLTRSRWRVMIAVIASRTRS